MNKKAIIITVVICVLILAGTATYFVVKGQKEKKEVEEPTETEDTEEETTEESKPGVENDNTGTVGFSGQQDIANSGKEEK